MIINYHPLGKIIIYLNSNLNINNIKNNFLDYQKQFKIYKVNMVEFKEN